MKSRQDGASAKRDNRAWPSPDETCSSRRFAIAERGR
jgi:hypothetical protein